MPLNQCTEVGVAGKGKGSEKGWGWENSKWLRFDMGGDIIFILETGNGCGRHRRCAYWIGYRGWCCANIWGLQDGIVQLIVDTGN